ncbi:DUF1592 domain-containing protein [Roseiconus nitratireducens]|uniref:DUF1592 domain-containing protein n=1 Tax=Roseiconus nitratireducens TaxID=2605748 RepID=A0A5M6DIJ3_9BACT|nr:DUF1592 domain-containing protein [Roseiconus nitratireducens]KAA5546196.1 DUF1592 domain-containing protein [Roseiconus nitratireducens]
MTVFLTRRLFVRSGSAVVFLAVWFSAVSLLADEAGDLAKEKPVSQSHFQDEVRPVLVEYCAKCHDPADESDPVGLLRAETAADVANDRGIWASVAEQLSNRTMPPADEPQPAEAERLRVTQWIDEHLKRTACDQGPFAGAPVPRRLNREQYEYAIEDLTGVEFDFVETFPSDGGGGEGFNNNGELLFLPPLLMERYLEVAEQITERVIDVPLYDKEFFPITASESDAVDLRLVERGVAETSAAGESVGRFGVGRKASLSLIVYQDGDYVLRTRIEKEPGQGGKLAITLDGQKLAPMDFQGASGVGESKVEVRLSRGAHVLQYRVGEGLSPMRIDRVRVNQMSGGDPAGRSSATERLFAPGAPWIGKDDRQAARKILAKFTRLAWRRPVTDAELDRLLALFERGIGRGEPFAQAIKLPVQAALVSPHFLFVTEQEVHGTQAAAVSDLELATRLSLFLWHSLPDDDLLRLATEQKLSDPDELKRQVQRMVADPRSNRFAKEFAGQWLGTNAVGRTKIPDTNFFKPAYTSELVSDLRRQVTETMRWMLVENRPITDWIDADYVVINRRLAKHYGIEPMPPSNEEFQHVPLHDSPRTGIVGMGAVHMLTSYSRRTSPVLRGGWVLETIFGVHLPSPPPDAGTLPGGEKESKDKTVRERLEQHRANPTCAACHDLIDPIGFAMENFDVLGRWRDQEGKQPIDAAGKLPSGETFDGPQALRKVLVERKHDFREQMCRKMLGYALGRSLTDADACTIEQLAERLRKQDDRILSLVEAIATSYPFTHRDPPVD